LFSVQARQSGNKGTNTKYLMDFPDPTTKPSRRIEENAQAVLGVVVASSTAWRFLLDRPMSVGGRGQAPPPDGRE
jgi:hypothetical protein